MKKMGKFKSRYDYEEAQKIGELGEQIVAKKFSSWKHHLVMQDSEADFTADSGKRVEVKTSLHCPVPEAWFPIRGPQKKKMKPGDILLWVVLEGEKIYFCIYNNRIPQFSEFRDAES